MKKQENLYRIGEISKLYNISSDILRHYEKIGLISPDFIGENGYRYYSKNQIWKLNNIRNLRNLGLGLVEIKEFLDERSLNSASEILEFQLEKIEENIKNLTSLREEIINKLENLNFFQTFKAFDKPLIKYIPERMVLYSQGSFHKDWEIEFEHKILNSKTEYDNDFILTNNEAGATISKENFLIGEYDIFSKSFIINEERGEIFSAGNFLTITFKGGYSNRKYYYNLLKKYISENNLKISGDCYEIYHIERHITEDENEFITEIQIPVTL